MRIFKLGTVFGILRQSVHFSENSRYILTRRHFLCYSVAGCPEAAVANIYSAMRAGIKHAALGLTVAHWAGVGHITHQTMAWPGLLAAAGLGWNANIGLVNI